jgi:hypothetical protein
MADNRATLDLLNNVREILDRPQSRTPIFDNRGRRIAPEQTLVDKWDEMFDARDEEEQKREFEKRQKEAQLLAEALVPEDAPIMFGTFLPADAERLSLYEDQKKIMTLNRQVMSDAVRSDEVLSFVRKKMEDHFNSQSQPRESESLFRRKLHEKMDRDDAKRRTENDLNMWRTALLQAQKQKPFFFWWKRPAWEENIRSLKRRISLSEYALLEYTEPEAWAEVERLTKPLTDKDFEGLDQPQKTD